MHTYLFRAIEPLEARIAPANFVVNSLNDGAPVADGQLTLREAIMAATTNQPSGDAARGDFLYDSITFAPALLGGTIAITSEFFIDGGGPLSITGPGLFDESISISGVLVATRLFRITAATESVTFEHLALKNGAVMSDDGGAIHNSTTLFLHDVLLSQNTARDGGAIFNTGGSADLTITSSRLLENVANADANSNGAAISHTGSNARLTIRDTIISGNISAEDGGGIDTGGGTFTTITRSQIVGNRALSSGDGAGIQNVGTMLIEGTTISGNTGAGVAFFGGGIRNAGDLVILHSTISGNTTEGEGGGIRQSAGSLAVINSTIAGNTALGGNGGGGLRLVGGTVSVVNSTIAGNVDASGNAAAGGGGIAAAAGVTLNMDNSIVAGNFASGAAPNDIRAAVNAGSVNNFIGIGDAALTGISNGVSGNQIGTDVAPLQARLGPLQDNGGQTFTMMPLAGSPVIDAGDPASGETPLGEALRHDQRGPGFGRRLDGDFDGSDIIDIGAAEHSPLTALGNDVTSFSFTQTDGDKITVTLTGGGTFDLLRDDDEIGQISIHNSTLKSVLTVKVTPGGGGGDITVDSIHADAGMKGISLGKGTTLTGTIGVEGWLGSLTLDQMNSDVLLRTGGTAAQKLAVRANDHFEMAIDTTSSVAAISLPKFEFRGAIRAASIGALTAKTFIGGAFNDALNSGNAASQDLIATVGGIGKIVATNGGIRDYEIRTPDSPRGILSGISVTSKGANSATGIADVGVQAAKIGKIAVTMTSAAGSGNASLGGIASSGFVATAGGIDGISVTFNFLNSGTRNGTAIGNFFFGAAGSIGSVAVKSAKEPGAGLISSGSIAAGTALRGWESLPTAAMQTAALKAFGMGNIATSGAVEAVTINASGNIGSFTAMGGTAIVDLLAGANLGSNFAVGGAGAAADIFLRPASIGAVKIMTKFDNTTISAGIAAVNNILGDGDDVAGIAGKLSSVSKIGPVTIGVALATVAVNGAVNHTNGIQAAAIGKVIVNGTAATLPTVLDTGNSAGTDDANDVIVRII